MKKLISFTLLAGILFFVVSCSKDDNDLKLQPHDDNRMMDSMHAMMNRMQAMPPTNDPEIDFPKMMIMHHQGAINMSNVLVQEGKNDSLKRFAQKVITAQQKEIQDMSNTLATLTVNNSVPEFTKEQMDHMMKMDQIADVQLITGDLDNDFATLMIQHHNAAIENSEAYLLYGNHDGLKVMAMKMIDDQKKEIMELSNWLKANKR
jgi:uncharacterized protein (DUF305 family)